MTGSRAPGSRVEDYDYALPEGRIARYPAERRDESRLLVVPRDGSPFRHLRFHALPELLDPGDVLVLNESRVRPWRLLGEKPTGASAEVLLLRPWSGDPDELHRPDGLGPASAGDALWEALVRPGGKLKPGRTVVVADDLRVEILDSTPESGRIVRLVSDLSIDEALDRYGHVPLPPYLDREDEAIDRKRYQTVYARIPGSVAAPTAGLHFTDELLRRVVGQGVRIARLTLHVGVGTFRPVEEERPGDHTMHEEEYEVPPEAARTINRARDEGGRVWAVGTTVVRTLESVTGEDGRVAPGRGSTDLFIHPPYELRAVDALVTNFHLPRSTLLMLVAAFAGYERTMEAYEEAIREDYRFYSYGDAMAVI